MPHLWGNPASHFGKEFDAVYIALVRFKRTLLRARLTTRELTHTLHLPPAQAELYDGPHSEWLQNILERLPRLQSLIVAQLPFFDHGALVQLEIPRTLETNTMYSLRLLDASGCINTTPQSLGAALKHFPALVYLDISGTIPARSPQVLSSLWRNPALQILKARGLALTDADIQIIAGAVGTNLRSLDVRDNKLTDQGVRVLLQKCIKHTTNSPQPRTSRPVSPSNDWNAAMQQRGDRLLNVYRTEDQDDYIRTNLTDGFVNYLGLESTSGSGITHLYISGNLITVEGVSGLLRSKRLHVLDAGRILNSTKIIPAVGSVTATALAYFFGAEMLTPVLDACAEELTYLRLDHAIVTKNTPSKQLAEMEDSSTLLFPQHSAELDTTESAVHEMPANQITELPGDILTYAELEGSPVPPSTPPISQEEEAATFHVKRPPAIRTASATAPELVSAISPTMDACGGLFSPISPFRPSPPTEPYTPIPPTATATSPSTGSHLTVPTPVEKSANHKRTYSGVLSDHTAQIQFRKASEHSFLPSMTPNLRTLVLTDVPLKASTPQVAKHLIQFITDCSNEAHWAVQQSKVGYALPPGRDRRSAERQYAHSLFPLQRIVLEMAPEKIEEINPARWQTTTYSSVLDPDCETLWNAAKDDFSFFGNEECGQPDADPASFVSLATLTEKMVVVPDEDALKMQQLQQRQAMVEQSANKLTFDVLAEVGKFRRERKAEFEEAAQMGKRDVFVEGYWKGEIVVVRPRR
jgi:hypothetical protein